MRLPVTTPPGALPSQFSTALQIPALSLLPDFFPGVLEVSGPSCTLGDRLGVGASLAGWPSLAAFLVLRQLLDTNRAGEGSVPVKWTEGFTVGLLVGGYHPLWNAGNSSSFGEAQVGGASGSCYRQGEPHP